MTPTWTYSSVEISVRYVRYAETRGFTGHEHYADLGIINMNGRLYDPVIARFFSPDNFVQAPGFTHVVRIIKHRRHYTQTIQFNISIYN